MRLRCAIVEALIVESISGGTKEPGSRGKGKLRAAKILERGLATAKAAGFGGEETQPVQLVQARFHAARLRGDLAAAKLELDENCVPLGRKHLVKLYFSGNASWALRAEEDEDDDRFSSSSPSSTSLGSCFFGCASTSPPRSEKRG